MDDIRVGDDQNMYYRLGTLTVRGQRLPFGFESNRTNVNVSIFVLPDVSVGIKGSDGGEVPESSLSVQGRLFSG